MKKGKMYVCIAVLAPLLLLGVGYVHRLEGTTPVSGADTLLLLLPDDIDFNTPAVRQWLDAASEEGLHVEPIHDSDFLDPLSTTHAAGVILPDQIHRNANDVLIGQLYRYVRTGGNLMVVYDACTWDLNGHFPPGDSRLSTLVGVRYALYDLYTAATMERTRVTGTSAAMRDIGIPPGSSVVVNVSFNPQTGGAKPCAIAVGPGIPDVGVTGSATALVSYAADIQPIFNSSCTSCHPPQSGLDLTPGVSYGNLVNHVSLGYAPAIRVVPNDPTNSVLYRKIAGTGFGGRMPEGPNPLPQVLIDKVRNWILQGALNN